MGGASSIGGEDVRPSRDVRSLLIPESHEFIRGSMSIKICKGQKRDTLKAWIVLTASLEDGIWRYPKRRKTLSFS